MTTPSLVHKTFKGGKKFIRQEYKNRYFDLSGYFAMLLPIHLLLNTTPPVCKELSDHVLLLPQKNREAGEITKRKSENENFV